MAVCGMNRRELLSMAALAGTAGAAVHGAATAPPAGPDTGTAAVQLPAIDVLREAPPLSRERAVEVMERLALDGLVVVDPVNVYHLTGFWPATARMGYEPNLYALLGRDPSQPVTVVASEFTYYYLLSDAHPAFPLELFLFSAPADDGELAAARAAGYRDDPPAIDTLVWPDAGEAPIGSGEQARRSAVDAATREQPVSADADVALVKALRALGLTRGTVAVDRGATGAVFERAGFNVQTVDAGSVMQRLRLVKSPREIALLRQAASANVAAALASLQAVRAGASYREMRALFYAEAARRGNRGVFMVIDGVSAESVDRSFRDGDAFLFDAVSEGAGYHGDFARTVFLGEPAHSMQKATAAIRLGWDTVRDALRPGLRFSEITALGRETLRKAGYDFRVAFGPHSVGLYHTDAPGLGDVTLEPGMVISVDCPVMQAGIGGTAHLEDLMLITGTGAEPLHPLPESVIVL
jgi:Xaa-Pro aminopeptidase